MSSPPSPPHPAVDRRTVLRTLLRGTCVLTAVGAGCGGEWRDAVVLDAPVPADVPDAGAPGTACSRAPSPASITRRAASALEAPVTMFFRNSVWPGASMIT